MNARSFFHHLTDTTMTFPVVVLVAGNWAPPNVSRPSARWMLLVLLLIPSLNYLASFPALHAFSITPSLAVALASPNAGALLVALAGYGGVAVVSRGRLGTRA